MAVYFDMRAALPPHFRAERALAAFRRRIGAVGAQQGVLALCEKAVAGTGIFDAWASGKLPLGETLGRTSSRAIELRNEEKDALPVFVLATRVYHSSEGLTILSYGARPDLPDAMPAAQLVLRILEADGLPSIDLPSHTLGGEGAAAVRQLFRRFLGTELALTETARRPALYGARDEIVEARSFARRVYHGSDPTTRRWLDEKRWGVYGDLADFIPDKTRPLDAALLSLLRNEALVTRGHRCSLLGMALRS